MRGGAGDCLGRRVVWSHPALFPQTRRPALTSYDNCFNVNEVKQFYSVCHVLRGLIDSPCRYGPQRTPLLAIQPRSRLIQTTFATQPFASAVSRVSSAPPFFASPVPPPLTLQELGLQLAWTLDPATGTLSGAVSAVTNDSTAWVGLGFGPQFPWGMLGADVVLGYNTHDGVRGLCVLTRN